MRIIKALLHAFALLAILIAIEVISGTSITKEAWPITIAFAALIRTYERTAA